MQNHTSQIKQLSNEKLLSQTKFLVQKERDVHIQVLHHLAEIDSRKLYFRQGFSSLFDYAVKELGYSEGAAYRRIKAMKLCQDIPKTESRLQTGRLSLSTACQLQVFFEKQAKKAREQQKQSLSLKTSQGPVEKREEKKTFGEEDSSPKKGLKSQFIGEKVTSPEKQRRGNQISEQFLSQEEKENLVRKVEGCSRRATKKLLSESEPSLSLPQEKTRFLGEGKVEVKIVIDEACYKRLEELKNLLSHRNPTLSYGELLLILSEEGLKKHDPRKRNIREKSKKTQVKALKEKSEFKSRGREQKVVLKKNEEKKIKKEEKIKEEKNITTSPEKEREKSPGEYQIRKINRTIPSWLKKYIWERDGGRCAYVYHKTNRRCSSKHLLQIDHIRPFAMGGKAEKENLRLLCAGHNQYRR